MRRSTARRQTASETDRGSGLPFEFCRRGSMPFPSRARGTSGATRPRNKCRGACPPPLFRTRHAVGSASQALRRNFAAREIVLEALDLLFLAIHEINVVAEKEAHVFYVVAGKLQFDGVELKQQIVSKGPSKREARRDRVAEFI